MNGDRAPLLAPETMAKLDALFPPDPLAEARTVYEEAVIEHRSLFGLAIASRGRTPKGPEREPGSHGRRKLTRRARMARGEGRTR